uniref:Methyltransferase small domain-containing protein n=1 Tax=Chenopodium quinoa TaxID=63459 RepID=A0A803NE00_CHEQI
MEFLQCSEVENGGFNKEKYGWRCRAKLAVRGSSANPMIGLYEEGTHNVVDIPECRAHHPNINAAVELLRKGIAKLEVEPYDEDLGTGELRYVQIIFGNRWRHLVGERDFWEHVGGIDIYLTPSSFGQANTRAFDSLLRKLHKYVPYGSAVTDLYGGAGVIGLSLAVAKKMQVLRSVRCVEINKESKHCFEKTVSRLPNVDSNMSWHNVDAALEPLSWLVGSDVIVVDPPRKGLDDSLLSCITDYIISKAQGSCFFQDCKQLLSNKAWLLEKAHGFNFFPGTQ